LSKKRKEDLGREDMRVLCLPMTQREAAERMGVSPRWVRKLLKRMKREGGRVMVQGCGEARRTARLQRSQPKG
jgi:DNA-binding transcriptional regulator LsrR (DeoR family)